MNTFAERLKHCRNQRNLSSEALGKMAGVNQTTISRLENGQTNFPSGEYLFKLADSLGVSARWLVTGTEPTRAEDSARNLHLSEDLQGVVAHLHTLEKSKLDAWITLLGVRR